MRSFKQIAAAIVVAIRADIKADETAHNLAVETLAWAAEHGDYTLFARLIGNVTTPGGETFERGLASRRLGLIEWANAYSPIRVNGDNIIGLLKPTAKDYRPFDIEGATANPFYTLKGEDDRRTKVKPFDSETIRGRIGSLMGAIEKAAEGGLLNDDREALEAFTKNLVAYAARTMRAHGLDPKAAKERRETFQPSTDSPAEEPSETLLLTDQSETPVADEPAPNAA